MNNDRIQTDFLCPRSSFITGMGTVINLGGNYFQYNTSDSPDEMAIESDWRITGQDIADALEQAQAGGRDDEQPVAA